MCTCDQKNVLSKLDLKEKYKRENKERKMLIMIKMGGIIMIYKFHSDVEKSLQNYNTQ